MAEGCQSGTHSAMSRVAQTRVTPGMLLLISITATRRYTSNTTLNCMHTCSRITHHCNIANRRQVTSARLLLASHTWSAIHMESATFCITLNQQQHQAISIEHQMNISKQPLQYHLPALHCNQAAFVLGYLSASMTLQSSSICVRVAMYLVLNICQVLTHLLLDCT